MPSRAGTTEPSARIAGAAASSTHYLYTARPGAASAALNALHRCGKVKNVLAAEDSLPIHGQRVGAYRVIGKIASGGMAAVYEVECSAKSTSREPMALKVVLPHLRNDRRFVEMFIDEARIASSIVHPNVVQVLETGEADGMPYIAMERLRGASLSAVVSRSRDSDRPVPPGFVLRVLAEAARGLHAAHVATDQDGEALMIVHRDVSPQNVFVGYDGAVKVVDFGVAAARGRLAETRSGELKGKYRYLAPEQVDRSRRPDRRTDIWALGVVAWELLSGRSLFQSDNEAAVLWNVLNAPIDDLGRLVPTVPSEVSALVMRCLQREVGQRPAGCDELARVFDAAAAEMGFADELVVGQWMQSLPSPDEEDPPEYARTRVAESAPRERRSVLPLVPAMGAAVLGVVGLWVAFSGDTSVPARASDDPTTLVAAPLVEPPVAEPSTRLELEVDSRAIVVLVDGHARDERPLVVDVEPGKTISVELVGSEGQRSTHVVSAATRGPLLLPETPESRAQPALRRNAPRAAGAKPAHRRSPADTRQARPSFDENPYE